jgi:hypothetical protein
MHPHFQQPRSAPSTPNPATAEHDPSPLHDVLNDSYNSPLGSWMDEEEEVPKEKRISLNAIKRSMSLRKPVLSKPSERDLAKRSDSLSMDN